MRTAKGGRLSLVLFIAILLLAFGLRFHLLEAQSFWNDEGNSARLSERSLALIIEGTAADIHPPLYYLLLRGWRVLVGETEFGLRAFSAFAGVLTVAGVAALTRRMNPAAETQNRLKPVGERNALKRVWSGGRGINSLALVAGLLTAVNPALIYYSQETRMYALLGLLAVLSTWCLLNWLSVIGYRLSVISDRTPDYRLPITDYGFWWAVAYVLLATAGLYSHYFFPAVLVAQNLIVLLWLLPFTIHKSLRLLPAWTMMMLAAFLLYTPWLPIFLHKTGTNEMAVRGALGDFLFTAVSWMTFGSTIATETAVWAVMVVIGVLVIGIWGGRRQSLVSFICLAVPLLFMYAVGAAQPQYFKFLLVAVPFLCVLLATAVTASPKKWQRTLTAVLLLIAIPLGTAQSLQNLYANPAYARADYRAMAARILAEDHANAGIILNAANQWEAFTYYYRDDTAVYPLPNGRSQPQPDVIDAILTEIAAKHDRLYAIFWGEAQRDPERLIERWLDEHAFKATDEWYGDVRFVTYAIPQDAATEMESVVNLPFGEAIALNGLTLNETQLEAGDILQVTLFWETAVPLNNRYKIFLHLIGPDGQLMAQRDSEPGGGLNLTTIWPPGEQIIDNHGLLLPGSLPPGDYSLIIGLYDLADPTARLPIQSQSGEVDSFPLATIQVK